VKAYKYLGVWFDTNLTWRLHKATILAKAKRRAYTMMGFGVCKILPAAACINLWEVLVRPILEYAGEVWGEGPWEEAEKLQREVGRLILGVPARTANEVVLGDLGWWELKARRDKARLKLFKKLRGLEDDEYARILVNDKGVNTLTVFSNPFQLQKMTPNYTTRRTGEHSSRRRLSRKKRSGGTIICCTNLSCAPTGVSSGN